MYRDVVFYRGLINGVDFQFPTNPLWIPWMAFTSDWGMFNLGSPVYIGWGALWGGLLQNISFGNLLLAQKLAFSGILVANFTMYFFLRNHVTKNKLAAFVGAVIYAYSPMTQSNYGTGLIWGVAFLPLAFNYLINIVGPKRKIRDALVLAVVLSVSLIYAPHIIPMFPIFALICVLITFRKGMRPALEVLSYFLAAFILFVLTNLTSIFLAVLTSTATVVHLVPTSLGTFWWNYQVFTPSNALKLTLLATPSNPVSTFLSFSPFGYIFPLVVFLPLLMNNNAYEKKRVLLFSMMVLLLDFFGFSVKYNWFIFELLYNLYTPIQVMRGPQSVLFFLSFAYSALLSLGVASLYKITSNLVQGKKWALRRKNITNKLLAGCIASLFLLSYFAYVPAYSEALHNLTPAYPNPAFYNEITGWLKTNESGGNFRILWLPWTVTSNMFFTNQFPWTFSAGLQGSTRQAFDYVNFVFSEIVENTTNLGAFLAPANVKYVVLILNTTEPDFTQWTMQGEIRRSYPYLVGNPLYFSKFLSTQKDLKLLIRTENYEIYENTEFREMVNASENAIAAVGTRTAIVSLSNIPGFNVSQPLIVFTDKQDLSSVLAKNVDMIYFDNCDLQDQFGSALTSAMLALNASFKQSLTGKLLMFNLNKSSLFQSTNFEVTSLPITDSLSSWNVWSNQSLSLVQDAEKNSTVNVEGIAQPEYIYQLIVAGYNNVGQPWNWTRYDFVRMSIKPSESRVAVALWGLDDNGQKFVVSNPSFKVIPNEWNLLNVPLNGLQLNKVVHIDFIMICNQTGSTGWMQIKGLDLIKTTSTTFSSNISLPVSDNFSVALEVTSGLVPGRIAITVDNQQTALEQLNQNWIESEPLFLAEGEHNLNITFLSPQLALVFSNALLHNGPRLDRIFGNSSISSFQWNRISEMEYTVNVTAEKPLFINLGQAFDPNWHAYCEGVEMDHIVGFSFTNAFYLNATGTHEIRIKYEVGSMSALAKSISILSMFFAISIVALDFIIKRIRITKKRILMAFAVYLWIISPRKSLSRARLIYS